MNVAAILNPGERHMVRVLGMYGPQPYKDCHGKSFEVLLDLGLVYVNWADCTGRLSVRGLAIWRQLNDHEDG